MSSPTATPPSTPATAASAKSRMQSGLARERVNRRSRRQLANLSPMGWFIIDASMAFFSSMVGFALNPYVAELGEVKPITFGIAFSLVLGVVSMISGLHDPRFRRASTALFGRVTVVVIIALVIIVAELALVQYLRVGRFIVAGTLLTCVVMMTAVRIVAWHFSHNLAPRIGLLGDDAFCFKANRFIEDHPQSFRTFNIRELSTDDQPLVHTAIDHQIDEIVFQQFGDDVQDSPLLECMDEGVNVSSYSDFVEFNYLLVPVDDINTQWLLSARLDLAHPYYYGVKRLIDLTVSVIGLILFLPLFVFFAILIKLESRGPILYSQIRAGRFNHPFRIYKLRTMVNDAEKDGAKWASVTDSRITRLGKFLRLTRIDEGPQFINVLLGEMSLVGPRPERPEFVKMLEAEIPFYSQRHLVKPGLTGWAQINYPYGASVDDARNKLTYDLYYIKRASLALDAQILLRTVGAVMKGSR